MQSLVIVLAALILAGTPKQQLHVPKISLAFHQATCRLVYEGNDVIIPTGDSHISFDLRSGGGRVVSEDPGPTGELAPGMEEMYVIPLRPGTQYSRDVTSLLKVRFPQLPDGRYRLRIKVKPWSKDEKSHLLKRF